MVPTGLPKQKFLLCTREVVVGKFNVIHFKNLEQSEAPLIQTWSVLCDPQYDCLLVSSTVVGIIREE